MGKKPPPSFSVYFKGSLVYPEAIPWQRVAEALRAVHGLSKSVETEHEEDSIRLIGVARGSAIFQCYAEHAVTAVDNLRRVGRMLDRNELPDDAAFRVRPIEELSRIAKSLACVIIIQKDRGDVLARIEPDSYRQIAGSFLVAGETTITGEVKRVGGATDQRCTLRIPDRPTLLYCDVGSVEVARELGKHLYEDVVVTGTAHWLKTSFEIVDFRIQSITQVPKVRLSNAFAALRAAGADAWDNVDDPRAFLRRIRG